MQTQEIQGFVIDALWVPRMLALVISVASMSVINLALLHYDGAHASLTIWADREYGRLDILNHRRGFRVFTNSGGHQPAEVALDPDNVPAPGDANIS